WLQLPKNSPQLLLDPVHRVIKVPTVDAQPAAAQPPVGAQQKMVPEHTLLKFVQCPPGNQAEIGDIFLVLAPHDEGRARPTCGSSDTLLKCFSCVTHSRNRSQHTRKIDRKTQLQGVTAPFRENRNPDPWHCVHRCMASARVSDRVHSMTAPS